MGTHRGGGRGKRASKAKSSMMQAADRIAAEIQVTTKRLAELARLMRDSRHLPGTASRISGLAASIKEDVTRLNGTLDRMERAAEAQREAASNRASSGWFGQPADSSAGTSSEDGTATKTEAAHGAAIVNSLKHSLLSTTAGLQGLLSSHTTSLNAVSERRNRIGIRPSSLPTSRAPPSLPQQQHHHQQHQSQPQPHTASFASHAASSRPFGSSSSSSSSSSTAVDVAAEFGAVTDQLLDSGATAQAERRSQDVEEIQRSTADVAQLFKRLAGIVSEQSEQVRAVEDKLDSSLDALEKGEGHLRRAEEAAGNNTVLFLQIGGVLMLALIIFALLAS